MGELGCLCGELGQGWIEVFLNSGLGEYELGLG